MLGYSGFHALIVDGMKTSLFSCFIFISSDDRLVGDAGYVVFFWNFVFVAACVVDSVTLFIVVMAGGTLLAVCCRV